MQRRVGRDVPHVGDFRKVDDGADEFFHLRVACAFHEKRADLHPILDAPQCGPDVDGYQTKESEGKQRERDGDDAEHRQQRGAAKGQQHLPEGEPHRRPRMSASKRAVSVPSKRNSP